MSPKAGVAQESDVEVLLSGTIGGDGDASAFDSVLSSTASGNLRAHEGRKRCRELGLGKFTAKGRRLGRSLNSDLSRSGLDWLRCAALAPGSASRPSTSPMPQLPTGKGARNDARLDRGLRDRRG